MAKSRESALAPYRIIDLTEGGCMIGARLLADLGADVIKIEPSGGSLSRIAPYYKNIQSPEKSLYWFAYNLNKRSVTLDITTVQGQKLFKKIVKTADVVMESFQPGYMDQLTLGYNDLIDIKPDLIMTSITPFGQSGPKAYFRGSDLTASASGSTLSLAGYPDRAPTWIGFPQALLFGGAEAAVGTLTALFHCQQTGEGQHVDVSLQECAVSPTQNALPIWAVDHMDLKRQGDSLFSPAAGIRIPTYFKCKDGHVFFFLQGGNEPFISSTRKLFSWMEEEGTYDERLNDIDLVVDFDARKMKQETVDIVAATVSKFMATKTKTELYKEGGIRRRILIAPLYTAQDICKDEQLHFRKYWKMLEHPELEEPLTYCGPFIRLSETPITFPRSAPLIGEHNDELLEEEHVRSSPRKKKESARKATKVFEGIKVAEFAWQLVGPLTSRYLADHGATVIRIETHTRPDTLRLVTPFSGNKSSVDSSMFYGRGGANKYCVSIDLNHPNGQKLAWKLIKWADIMTQSFSPRVMERWGLDYESVKKVKPEIIYLSSSMQGNDGPHSGYSGFGQNACALSGFSEISGWPDRMPAPPYGAYTDYLCPRFNATALIAALEYHRRTGKGQLLEQSQIESSLYFLSPIIMDYWVNGRLMRRNGNRFPFAAPHGVFPCKGDDNWIAIAIFTDEEWHTLCKAMGNPDLASKPEFATISRRKENERELESLLSEWTMKYADIQLEKQLQEIGLRASIVAKPSNIYEDSQIRHRQYFTKLEHAVMGWQEFETQACFLLSKTPREIVLPSPCLGEHNAYVFRELLGMTDDEIAEHIIDGSITTDLPDDYKTMA